MSERSKNDLENRTGRDPRVGGWHSVGCHEGDVNVKALSFPPGMFHRHVLTGSTRTQDRRHGVTVVVVIGVEMGMRVTTTSIW
jgi:hypothetical protein